VASPDQKRRYAVLTLGGVAAVSGFATLVGEIPQTVRIVTSFAFLILVAANVAYSLHLINASARERERLVAAESARDKIGVSRHVQVIRMLEANNSAGALELLRQAVAALGEHAPIATVTCVVRDSVPSLLVRNDGAGAEFSGKFRVVGPVKEPWNWVELRCLWEDSTQEWVTIAKGDTRRIVLADRDSATGTGGIIGSRSKWLIRGLLDGALRTIESHEYGDAFFTIGPVTTAVVILEGFVIGRPDLANGLQPFRVTLGEHGATCEQADSNQPDVSLLLDWKPSALPDRFTSSEFAAFEITRNDEGVVAATAHHGVVSSALTWPDNAKQFTVVRCEITNDSSVTISNVRVTFEARDIRDGVPNTLAGSVDVEIPMLKAGDSVQFYLYSTATTPITLRLPDTVSFELPDDGQRRYVQIPAVRFQDWKFPEIKSDAKIDTKSS
jgi:hypothetical protein